MAGIEFALGIKQIGVGALVRECAGRKRRHELLRGLCQHAADLNLPLLEAPDQVQRLVGGDAAPDDKGDPRLLRCRSASDDPGADVRGLPDGLMVAWLRFGATLDEFSEDYP